jgi:hypothetical protein
MGSLYVRPAMKRAIPSLVIGLAGVALFTYELIQVFNIGTCASGGGGGRVPDEALASLAAVTRAASESAVAGAPSAIPAIPSVPAFGVARRRDPLDRLQELAALRERGALTAAEFESQKANILAET